ncbi:flagellar biosynthesis anti-sigma factor FlgM [Chromohalobacter canadensis]|uniref:flagellar biosynthesis anti-sigma factor FlgM n=1 Tax=Chromohalobacter canadensis TaxID=141389 RepID=UPI0021BE1649|nr:flagellar biosynthesis anti-sigma factor FlgM [Chromohalobacter canadensis]MCT8472361.1 flagellar biosynthesis anti-sigma factor FlgM [Chromohalobacter canadensis]MCT8499526.1 flagellar biosynthesis anti-sigma factor FlgM [Chromohalobacter canadensis]
MKISNLHPPTQAAQTEQSDAAQRTPRGGDSAQTNAPASTTTLSQSNEADTSQDIDTARVDEIRQAISEGQMELDTGKIADGLIDSVRDMLGDTSAS